jgi:hypothetical protein
VGKLFELALKESTTELAFDVFCEVMGSTSDKAEKAMELFAEKHLDQPHVKKILLESMKDRPFDLVGVNGDKLDDSVRDKIADKKITWRSFKNEQSGQAPLSGIWASTAGRPSL